MSLQTREGSTLVIVTFLASASLLLVTVPKGNFFLYNNTIIAQLGFVFAFIGFTYRQVTAWTIDRKEHNRRARSTLEGWLARQRKDEYYLYGGVRGFLVVFFLLIPTIFWMLVLSEANTASTFFIAGIYALIIAGIDAAIRWYDKCAH